MPTTSSKSETVYREKWQSLMLGDSSGKLSNEERMAVGWLRMYASWRLLCFLSLLISGTLRLKQYQFQAEWCVTINCLLKEGCPQIGCQQKPGPEIHSHISSQFQKPRMPGKINPGHAYFFQTYPAKNVPSEKIQTLNLCQGSMCGNLLLIFV